MSRGDLAARWFPLPELYPNIDNKKAIIALDLLLREGKVAQTPLLVQFTMLVFENIFL